MNSHTAQIFAVLAPGDDTDDGLVVVDGNTNTARSTVYNC
jgi:hypothetical protein